MNFNRLLKSIPFLNALKPIEQCNSELLFSTQKLFAERKKEFLVAEYSKSFRLETQSVKSS